jgi:iron complex outermembrane receptor protein
VKNSFGASKLFACSAILAAGAFAGAALAQTSAPADKASADTGELEEVIVEARFTKEAIQDIPLAISSVTAEEIQARGFVDVADVAADIPSVSFQPTGDHYGKGISAYIRGVGQSDSSPAQSPAVGFYLDDVYIGTVNGGNTALFDVESVDVLRGPQGTLFGANTESGAVQIRSVAPKGDNSGYVEIGYGSYNHEIGKGVFDVPLIDNTLFLRAGVTVEKQQGFENLVDYVCAHPGNPYTGSLPAATSTANGCITGQEGGIDTVGLKAALRWLVADNLEVNVKADYTDDTGENPATKIVAVNVASSGLQAANGNFTKVFGGEGYGPWFMTNNIYTSYASYTDPMLGIHNDPHATYQGYGVSGNIDWHPGNLEVKSITAYRTTNTGGPDSNGAPVPIVESYQTHYAYQGSEEIDINGRAFSDALDWTVGGFLYDSLGYQNGDIDIPIVSVPSFLVGPAPNYCFAPPGLPPGACVFYSNQYDYLRFIYHEPVHDLDKSLFVHGIYHFTDKLALEAGARYTDQSKTFTLEQYDQPANLLQFPWTTATSTSVRVDPKLGLEYHWAKDFMTYASYATGFKGGGVNPEATISASQITPFKPEVLKDYELGFKSEWLDHHVRLNADVFYMIYTGLQLTFVNGTLPEEGNVGRATISGAELEFNARAGGWLINASGSYLDYNLTSCAPGCVSAVNTGGVPPGAIAPQTPKWKGAVGLQYTWNLGTEGSLSPRLDYSYQSLVYNDPTDDPLLAQHGYGLGNFHLTWDTLDHKWATTVTVSNLFNKMYYTTEYEFYANGVNTGNPGAPREWLLTMRRSF